MQNANKCNYYTISCDTDILLAIIDYFGSQEYLCDSFQFDSFYNRLYFLDRSIEARWSNEALRTHINDYIDNNRDIILNNDENNTS